MKRYKHNNRFAGAVFTDEVIRVMALDMEISLRIRLGNTLKDFGELLLAGKLNDRRINALMDYTQETWTNINLALDYIDNDEISDEEMLAILHKYGYEIMDD